MTEERPSFVDKLKAKADELHLKEKVDELHLKEKVEELADQADKLTRQAAGKVGEVTHENRDKVEGFLDKAAAKVDEQTGGKYHDKIAKARESASKGVEKVAEQRTQGGEPAPGTSGHAAPPPPTVPPTPAASPTPAGSTATTPPEPATDPSVPEAPDEPLPPAGGPDAP